MGAASARLSKMVGVGLSVGETLRREVWREGSIELVLGSVERARHTLLAGERGRVRATLRLFGGRCEASAACDSDRGSHQHRAGRRESGRIPAKILGARG